jgi:hypothetical protein
MKGTIATCVLAVAIATSASAPSFVQTRRGNSLYWGQGLVNAVIDWCIGAGPTPDPDPTNPPKAK